MNHRARNERFFFFVVISYIGSAILGVLGTSIYELALNAVHPIQKCNLAMRKVAMCMRLCVCVCVMFIDIFYVLPLDACEMTQYCNGVHLHSFYVFGNPFYVFNLIHE